MSLTKVGISAIATTPNIQNRLTITPVRHSRMSAQSSPISRTVERATLRSITVSGAAAPTLGT